MSKKSSHRLPLIVKSFAIASMIGLCLPALPSDARFNPGGTVGKPGNRRGLATRGGGCKVSGEPTLTALVPKNNMGLSASATPTLHWFIPQNTYKFMTFSLYVMDAEDNPQDLIYTSRLEVSGQPELASVTIPEQDTAALEPGVNYRWVVKLHCSETSRRGLSAMGWLNYIPPSPEVMNQLASAPPEDQYNIYAEAGYWYDAVRELVAQKRINPQSPTVKQAWKALMESEHVQLSQLATQ
ncbi:DUF928 domain-containing protein [Acaryochloris sp. IP29b_bin.148]|uniref:DUF928 domain-containing protein n=1 Tax=Acaryochloris sp. IP29b_bin.148 TaxID=2969218 RepID=UPI00260EC072|nr:DUF928 domain-containing protein [Acaryochloris sp. IP29b_bin.148]